MTDATARYVIAAEDRTKAAADSIKRNFKDIDGAARKLSRGLKGLGVGAVALKAWSTAARLGDAAIQNLASSNTKFADSLRETETAMKGLWTAGERTIETQEKLNTLLKDPAAQSSVSGLADKFGQLRLELKALLPAWTMVLQHGTDTKRVFEELAKVQVSGPQSRGYVRDLGDVDAAQKLGKSQNAAFDARMKAQADAAKKAADGLLSEVQITAISLFDRTKPFRQDAPRAIDAQQLEDTRFDQFGDSILESTQGIADNMSEIFKQPFDELSPYADEAARNMQTAFADFLFDPFEDGIKGMLRGFVDVLRRMVAEAAAAKIFGSKKSGGLGLGDLVTGAVGSLFGFAQGGSFNVGGSGGTDSQLVAFKATPGERVSVSTPAQQKSGRSIVVHQSVTVNAAQLTQDQAARMVADSQRMMWDELDRRYGLA